MAKPQEKQAFNVSNVTPIIMENDQEGRDTPGHNYYDEEAVSGNGCGCFRLFCCFDNQGQDGEAAGFLRYQSRDVLDKDNWFLRRTKSLKEYSELVAGPKWKNFIRKLSRKPRWRKAAATGNMPFQYDPQSYALNFNDGGDFQEDDDLLPRSFSTRYAPAARSIGT